MKAFNMDLNIVTNTFKYVRLPLIIKEGLKDFMDNLIKDIIVFRPDIVVVDSITPQYIR